ncbi:hypothetical protein POTOM_024372 [Populus tomentosa]|uniref:RRM domain-containing protein n=1 Tax=Populus tomentosa TaxID=118781 RepID=A0A8X8D0A9_POPTO|nr:hypothetical protein POTOM_024372 [Populus tomentosa]
MSRVYVGNLDPRVSERDLEDEFRRFGVIRSVWVARRPPGYAFIDFDDKRDAQDAIHELDGATALEDDPPSAAVCHLVGAAIAGHHNTVDVKSSHMPTEMASGIGAEAGVKSCCLGDLALLGEY